MDVNVSNPTMATDGDHNPCHLLKIAPELRIRIYEYVYGNVSCALHTYEETKMMTGWREVDGAGYIKTSGDGHGRLHNILALLQTCRIIYREALPALYDNVLFQIHIHGHGQGLPMQSAIHQPGFLTNVRRLRLSIYLPLYKTRLEVPSHTIIAHVRTVWTMLGECSDIQQLEVALCAADIRDFWLVDMASTSTLEHQEARGSMDAIAHEMATLGMHVKATTARMIYARQRVLDEIDADWDVDESDMPPELKMSDVVSDSAWRALLDATNWTETDLTLNY